MLWLNFQQAAAPAWPPRLLTQPDGVLPPNSDNEDEFSEDLDSALRSLQAISDKVPPACHLRAFRAPFSELCLSTLPAPP